MLHFCGLLLVPLLLLPPSSAIDIQVCTDADHVNCIVANGNGWGCDVLGDAGSCCEGDCGEAACDTWVCKQIAIAGGNDLVELEHAFEDFIGAIGHTVGGGTGSGMGSLLAVPSFVGDLAWVQLVKAFRTYVLADGTMTPPGIIRIGGVEVIEQPDGTSGGTCQSARGQQASPRGQQASARGHQSMVHARSPQEAGPTRIIEFMRPTADRTVLSAVVVMHIAEDCTLVGEDYYAYGAYGWSTNRGGARLRPPPQERLTDP